LVVWRLSGDVAISSFSRCDDFWNRSRHHSRSDGPGDSRSTNHNSFPDERQPETPRELGEALAHQFALIDRNIEAVARTVNAQTNDSNAN
jgi:hypothetical protein